MLILQQSYKSYNTLVVEIDQGKSSEVFLWGLGNRQSGVKGGVSVPVGDDMKDRDS